MSTPRPADDIPLPGGNFRLFIQRLGYQGLMTLGLIENPVTGTREPHLENARMLIDDLLMLQEKTRGNLDGDEEEHLRKLIGDLERAFEGGTGTE
jgi:hypothetical protein